jgi:hypothetical protein
MIRDIKFSAYLVHDQRYSKPPLLNNFFPLNIVFNLSNVPTLFLDLNEFLPYLKQLSF